MALYRTISLSFWTDTKIMDKFTPKDKLFYLYLMTNPHTNLCGCYEISKSQMSMEIGYTKEEIAELINKFEKEYNIIKFSTETSEIILFNWHKYNWTSSPKFKKPLKEEIKKIKNESFRKILEKIEIRH